MFFPTRNKLIIIISNEFKQLIFNIRHSKLVAAVAAKQAKRHSKFFLSKADCSAVLLSWHALNAIVQMTIFFVPVKGFSFI